MTFSEKMTELFDGEKKMVEREHKRIRKLIERVNVEGGSMCFYSHDSSDGWTWEDIDYLKLRMWLNSHGFFTLKKKDGIYILWSFDRDMRSLIHQQAETLTALYKEETANEMA